MDNVTTTPIPKGASQDTPQTQLQVTKPQLNKTKKSKRISGAEQKRRKKARLAQMGQTGPTPSSKPTTSRGTAPTRRQAPRANSDQAGQRVGEGKKRQRSDDSTPTQPPTKKGPTQPEPKAGSSKAEPPRNLSYKQAVERQLRVAIIDSNNPLGKLTANQAGMVQSHLAKVLDQHLFALTGATLAPTFRGWRYSGEILRISCDNNHSLEWLKKAVGNLPPLWEAAHLMVVQEDCLPRLCRAAIWVPGEPEDLVVVRQRLETQNSWARVGSWCVFHTAVKDQPQGRLVVFGIEEMDQTNLIARGGRLGYGFSTLKVKVSNPTKPEVASTSVQPPQPQHPQLPQEQLPEATIASPPRLRRQPVASACSSVSNSPGPFSNWEEFANIKALLETDSNDAVK
ncbi:hypothetical protein RI129_003022 [Pyrocoelia pectoralis]|uniref:DUF4780 domain-containing protein n=1 Tax=Pyrocoelia pectoralis TaxID=417401 RepID=A0AAN7VG99_9COLE